MLKQWLDPRMLRGHVWKPVPRAAHAPRSLHQNKWGNISVLTEDTADFTSYTGENPVRILATLMINCEDGQGGDSRAASSPSPSPPPYPTSLLYPTPPRSILSGKFGDPTEASLSKPWPSPRLAAPEPHPPFPGKTPGYEQRPHRLEGRDGAAPATACLPRVVLPRALREASSSPP